MREARHELPLLAFCLPKQQPDIQCSARHLLIFWSEPSFEHHWSIAMTDNKSSSKRSYQLRLFKMRQKTAPPAAKLNLSNSWFDDDLRTTSDELLGLEIFVPDPAPAWEMWPGGASESDGKSKASSKDGKLRRELQIAKDELQVKDRYIQDLEARLEISENPSSSEFEEDDVGKEMAVTALSDYMHCVFGEPKKENDAFC